ncbi:hypothetical protein, conserved [Plasmodium gonderi]|uniref:Uncharacterized protein n=1 Tax=Plasmodium gonderi TaxID=77519 RepID=A0A1Y1JCP2_PLAGO|nr:hypothetical protein, conserved [Plasmodium gonderi]GAW79448.1 hypothetical protein, conserved [Plasmodium gonderi]
MAKNSIRNREKKKKNVTLETVQREYKTVLQKKSTDIYITSEKPLKIYYDRILKILNNGKKQVEHVIEGENKIANIFEGPSKEEEEVHVHAVGRNILRASYLLQDVVNYYCEFLKNIPHTSKQNRNKNDMDVFSFIDITVESNTLLMNDTVITNTYTVKDEFLQDEYDSIIALAKEPYDFKNHEYMERSKERRITGIVISIKKKPFNM